MSAFGTFATCRRVRYVVASRGKADVARLPGSDVCGRAGCNCVRRPRTDTSANAKTRADRSQRRADPDPLVAARARPGQQDRCCATSARPADVAEPARLPVAGNIETA